MQLPADERAGRRAQPHRHADAGHHAGSRWPLEEILHQGTAHHHAGRGACALQRARDDQHLDAVGERFVETELDGDLLGKTFGQIAEAGFHAFVTAAENGQLGGQVGDAFAQLQHQIEAFLLSQTADNAEQGTVVRDCQPHFLL